VQFTGKIASILYDCFGDFEGFILDTCEAQKVFKSCERAVEEVIRRACSERVKITIYADGSEDNRVFRIVVHCCR